MKNYILIVLLGCCTLFFWASCTKMDGYYDYQNRENLFNGNTIEYLESKTQVYDSLLKVLNLYPELKATMKTDSVTLFAPTNSSFQSALYNFNLIRKNQKKNPLYIKDLDLVQLDTVLSKYLVGGIVTTDSMLFVDGLFIKTLKISQPMHAQRIKQQATGLVDGGLVTVFYSDTKGSNFSTYWTRSATQAVNIKTTNGVVHILSNGHEFGFGEFLTRFNR
ncbi:MULTISPECIES: fasciclin domain-containing protein [unclassified Sphingobacterium]|uniref:fasciclin domain-containing protein n=1 Tax=unclassified Sphingobacterium TaxID=2609468 RepID=UPI00104E65A3|nr:MULTISPECIES: fasciclin domain-containing protein [unclassified Sphingobacterium]MCS3555750.1 hypothetical protein [Sphingobacterium sp. JUb21]TCR00797.1 fasciclin domain-containing protein [Sphingobacterium sp. JUb20]